MAVLTHATAADSVVEVLLLDLLLERGLIPALRMLLLLHRPARSAAETSRTHREGEPGKQALEVGRGARRTRGFAPRADQPLELVATRSASEIEQRHARIVAEMRRRGARAAPVA